MRKKIKVWGGSFILLLSPEDMEVNGWKKGDILELETKKILTKQTRR